MTQRLAIAILFAVACSAPVVIGQEPAKPAQEPAKPTQEAGRFAPPGRLSVTALVVDVTLSRYLGEKKLSSTPYTLSVSPDNRASLRMGGDVPVQTPTFSPGQKEEGKPATTLSSYSYRSIGTNIDVLANGGFDGQYRISLTIEDSSIYPPELAPASSKATGAASFRSFKSSNVINLRDAQSLDYTMATDRLTGEVYRVTVKLTVVK